MKIQGKVVTIMANIYKGTLGLIGNTPLVEVINIEKELGLEATVLVKLEYFNPRTKEKPQRMVIRSAIISPVMSM